MFVRVEEIIEQDEFQTQHGTLCGWKFRAVDENNNECFLICFLTDGAKGRRFLNKKRIYCDDTASEKFVESPRNEHNVAELT